MKKVKLYGSFYEKKSFFGVGYIAEKIFFKYYNLNNCTLIFKAKSVLPIALRFYRHCNFLQDIWTGVIIILHKPLTAVTIQFALVNEKLS